MKIDPRHLEILAAIVDNGGLTEGAIALGKSQPSVSRSLSMLEGRIGQALFVPNRRPLQPTDFCLLLAKEGRKIVQAGRAASTLVKQYKDGYAGAVRVGGTPIFMDGVVAPVLASLQAEYPEIQISQSYDYPGSVLTKLSNGTLDVGIVPIRTSEVPAEIKVRELLPGKNVVACRVGHPLAKQASVKLVDVANYAWIAPPPDSPLYHDLRAALNGIGVNDFKVSFSGGSLASVINILSNSDSLTVLPHSVLAMQRSHRTLAELPVALGDPDRHLSVLATKEVMMQPAAARLITFVENQLKHMHLVKRHS